MKLLRRSAVTARLVAAEAELAAVRAALADAVATCDAAADGDFEVRMGPTDHPSAAALRTSLNRVLDRTDMFLREAGASSAASADGRFYRRFVGDGMTGSYTGAAVAIDATRKRLADAAVRQSAVALERLELADSLEDRVLGLSANVAASATELGATADDLAASAGVAVACTGDAVAAMASLSDACASISDVTRTISTLAEQIKMLSLNARIEAARAGEAGKGFTVVSAEIGVLAGNTAAASEAIGQRIDRVLEWAEQAAGGSRQVADAVSGMDGMTEGIATAAGGSAIEVGLAQMAEQLRAEVADFVDAIRQH